MTTATTSRTSAESPARPVHEIRLGRIKGAIWANKTENGMRHNVTFQRIYHDGEGWNSSDSFGRDDLPILEKVADRACQWIYEHGKESDGQAA